MIGYTVEQAAARVGRKPRTIRQWISNGDLFAIRNPIDGRIYVEETRLLDTERAKRQAQRATRAVTLVGSCCL